MSSGGAGGGTWNVVTLLQLVEVATDNSIFYSSVDNQFVVTNLPPVQGLQALNSAMLTFGIVCIALLPGSE
jgi:hypothetical protein